MARFTEAEVVAALTSASDDIAEATGMPDSGARDALNLLVNAALTYLRDPSATLDDVISENYSIGPDEEGPVEWIKEGLA